MSLIRSMVAAHPRNPPQWLVDFFAGSPSSTGMTVNPDTAEQVTAVFASVALIAETVAMLPLHLYRDLPGGGKEREKSHRLATLLSTRPNPWQSPFDFKEMMTGHAVLRGNAYAQIVERNDGQTEMLVPLHPDRLIPKNDPGDGRVVYEYQPLRGAARTFETWQLFKIFAHSTDGITGRSPIAVAREAVGLAMAAEQFGGRFFSNGARPAGILTHPGKLSKDAKERLRADWQKLYGGTENANRTAVLEEGVSYTQVGMKLDDAQFLETRKYQVTEIARLFRVPPHMIGDLERSTNNNIEQQGIEFIAYTMMPWLIRWEEGITRDLLTEQESQELFAKFQVAALLRGVLKDRYDAYAVGRNWGWLSPNEIRAFEDMNPLPSKIGDVYLQPSNMVDPTGARRPLGDGGASNLLPALLATHADLLADGFRRAGRRAGQLREKKPDLGAHAEFIAQATAVSLQAFADLVAELRGLDTARCREAAQVFGRQRAAAIAERTAGLPDPETHDWHAEAEDALRALTTILQAAAAAPALS